MIDLNGQRCLDQNIMAQFLSNCSNDEPIVVLVQGTDQAFTPATLRDFFVKQEFPNVADDEEIYICSADALLTILGIDYHWWNTTRRINKLFGGGSAPKPKKQTVDNAAQIVVGISYENNEEPMFFEGTRKQCAEWLNKNYQLYCIKCFFEKKVLVSLDKDVWKPIDEYVQEGRISL